MKMWLIICNLRWITSFKISPIYSTYSHNKVSTPEVGRHESCMIWLLNKASLEKLLAKNWSHFQKEYKIPCSHYHKLIYETEHIRKSNPCCSQEQVLSNVLCWNCYNSYITQKLKTGKLCHVHSTLMKLQKIFAAYTPYNQAEIQVGFSKQMQHNYVKM